jgi:hypothetical protein
MYSFSKPSFFSPSFHGLDKKHVAYTYEEKTVADRYEDVLFDPNFPEFSVPIDLIGSLSKGIEIAYKEISFYVLLP